MKFIITWTAPKSQKRQTATVETGPFDSVDLHEDCFTVWRRNTPRDIGYLGETFWGVAIIKILK